MNDSMLALVTSAAIASGALDLAIAATNAIFAIGIAAAVFAIFVTRSL